MMEYEIIHSLKLANYLVRQGHDIVKVDDSEKNPKFKVFMFTKSKELSQAIKSYK